jgi:hypothetical protein
MLAMVSVDRNHSPVNECAPRKGKRGVPVFFLPSSRVPALRRDLCQVYDVRRLALWTADRYQKAEQEDHRRQRYRGEYERDHHSKHSTRNLKQRTEQSCIQQPLDMLARKTCLKSALRFHKDRSGAG